MTRMDAVLKQAVETVRICGETQFAQLRGSVGLSVTLGTIALIAIGCGLELLVTLIAIPIDEGTRAVGLGVG